MTYEEFSAINKPSELLELALKDLRAVERDDQYVVQMKTWHAPMDNGKCAVCLAGAVLACHLNISPNQNYYRIVLPDSIENRMSAINNLRVGDISIACGDLGIPLPDLKDRIMTPYGQNGFYEDIEKLITDLKSIRY